MNIVTLILSRPPISPNAFRVLLGSANNPVAGSRILAKRRLVP